MSEQVEQTPVVEQRPEVVSVKSWLVYLLVLSIPIVNIVMLFIYAFGGDVNKNKSNLAKASLLLALLFMIISIVFSFLIGAIITGFLGDYF